MTSKKQKYLSTVLAIEVLFLKSVVSTKQYVLFEYFCISEKIYFKNILNKMVQQKSIKQMMN